MKTRSIGETEAGRQGVKGAIEPAGVQTPPFHLPHLFNLDEL